MFGNKIEASNKYICFKKEYSEFTGLVHGAVDSYMPCEKVRKDIQFSSVICADFIRRADNGLVFAYELEKVYKERYTKKLADESHALIGCSVTLLIFVVIMIIAAILA